jgi:putative phage-type endonuclease
MTRQIQMPGRCRLLLGEDATVDEWLHARTLGIGGSEVAALIGVSPYSTSWDVFKAKVTNEGTPAYLGEEPISGPKIRAELLTDNPIFEWGHRLEEAIALKVADELGGVHRPGGGVYQHLDHPVAIVTPDRVLTKPRSWKPQALIECKHSGDTDPWDEDVAPIHYQVQAQWQMGITGLKTCYLGCFVLNFERDFFLIRVDFDEKWFGELVEVAENFWRDHVLTGELPEHDYAHPRTTEILKEQHPRAVLESVQWDDEAREWIEQYLDAKRRVDEATAVLEERKNWLRFHVGDAGAAYIGDDKVVSYPEVVTRKISATKLRENFPEVAEACVVTSSHRRMTVKRPTAPADPN